MDNMLIRRWVYVLYSYVCSLYLSWWVPIEINIFTPNLLDANKYFYITYLILNLNLIEI